MVAVNEYHFCRSILSQNGLGFPKAGSFLAIFFHNFHEPDSAMPLSFAGAKLFTLPVASQRASLPDLLLQITKLLAQLYQLLLQLESALSIAAAIVQASGI